ncbi:alpha/beta-Hydrolases superfamily protein [Perilla frutescens var. hirtella]|uniref:Alpha/beta-Hydrolases superfamily protein n=1 Tax=Perilla frutescens var. hirtella TaxID=608512 RepID=A0AAD4J9U5_PERFH|nr:alpha/beta-Hydrolases superfamily protein [Perilla frutescens var. hirtella]
MQIGATLPAHNLQVFQARRSVFECSGSPLNPLKRTSFRKPPESLSTEMTKKHLSNLERLLQKQSHPDPPLDRPEPPRNEPNIEGETRSRGILEGLSLARVWPEMKAAEEMSPRNLNRLQRLLSKSAEYSPRNSLGSRWREYHGSNDWAGMLDPLDENLRREVVRYGEFIQAAYHGFHSKPATSPEEAQRPRHVALPDRSYRVTKSLYATASVGLPKWVDEVAPDLGWMTQRTSWVGYVAVCDDRREIQRMGRRDIVIALRGTSTCLEWAENVRDILVPIAAAGGDGADRQPQPPKVECGFLSLLKTRGEHVPSLADSVIEEIKRLMEKYKGESLSITITGHSLGAALALLVGDELSTCAPDMPSIAVFSFGGPRVGNRGFANRLESNNVKVLRVVNSQDLVTRVPGMFVNEDLDKKLRATATGGRILDALDNNMPWAYAHVGAELRVDTKMSPFLKPDADVSCCHDLEAYLHLVDGFLASNCPFRPNAKRSLWKLLNEQRSNVKRLYTSKAKGLRLNNVANNGMAMSNCLPSPS